MINIINIAILGFGNIGSGVADVLKRNMALVNSAVGDEIYIKYVLDKRDLSQTPYADRAVHDFETILSDDSVSIVCEMLGGTQPAYDYSMAALKAGKSVITSNKEVVARFGINLVKAASENGVYYLYEASVGGAIPIVRTMKGALIGTEINRIDGILNGTTNYILTRMHDCSLSFDDALSEARRLGYAETNPTADISGADSCRKICILAAVAWGAMVPSELVHCEGITDITTEDEEFARSCGGVLKLVATAKKVNEVISLCVTPCVVLSGNPIASASEAFNAVKIDAGDMGNIMLYGMGAGKYPTASAIISDMIYAAGMRDKHHSERGWYDLSKVAEYADIRYAWCVLAQASSDEIASVLPKACFLSRSDDECTFICEDISLKELKEKMSEFTIRKLIRALV